SGGGVSNADCPTDLFRCNNGKCISHHWVCNYQKDCDDGEDEMQSCPPPECETPQLNCGQYVFNKTYCIPPHYRCDMIEDCEDKSDEAQCSKYTHKTYTYTYTCTYREYTRSGMCVGCVPPKVRVQPNSIPSQG
ncbi:GL16504, partial [Drosophila persimilis]